MIPGVTNYIWWVIVVNTPKFHLNAHNVWQNYSNLIKRTFWISLVKPYRMMYNLTGFSDVRTSLVFGNAIIVTSFLVTWFSNLLILWTLKKAISLKTFNAINCLGQVLQKNYKTQWWRNYDVTSYFWELRFLRFEKLPISYQAAKFQIPQLSEPNFSEVSIRHSKTNYHLIMMSLHNIWFHKLHIL